MNDQHSPDDGGAGVGAPVEGGSVVLDIGGDIGAVVISAPADLEGAEIEICPSGLRGQTPDEGEGWLPGGWRGTHGPPGEHNHSHTHDHDHDHGPAWPHVAVLPRRVGPQVVHAAVFGRLRAGRYDLWVRPDGPLAHTVEVAGGSVTTLDW